MNPTTLDITEIPNPTPDDDILCVCFDKDGNQWMGTRHHGVLINGKSYIGYPEYERAFVQERINDIMRDSKDRIWIGAVNSGIYLSTPDGKGGFSFQRMLNRPEIRNEVNILHQLKDGTICAGFGRGFILFNPDELIADTTKYTYYSAENSAMASEEIRDILEDEDGNLWVATVGAGLLINLWKELGDGLAKKIRLHLPC